MPIAFNGSGASFWSIALLCAGLAGCAPAEPRHVNPSPTPSPSTQPAPLSRFDYTAPKMGTVFHMSFYAPDAATADRAAAAVWTRVDQLNATFSDYDPNTELSRLGQMTLDGPMTQPAPVSDDMYHLLGLSLEAADASSGTFDITVGPLSQLFRRARRLETLPTAQRIAEARKSVGYQNIRLDRSRHAVQLTAAKMRLDVGGIAKGFASTEMLKVLKEQFGITRALCGAAGDVAIGDAPPGKTGWTVALQNLDATAASRGAYVRLQNYGVSTSGDTERFVIIDGVRYSHLIDPRTGMFLSNRIGCSAIAPNDVLADWLAAAVCVLGPDKGLELIERTPGAACRVTQLDAAGKVNVWESKRFPEFLVEAPAQTFRARAARLTQK